MRTKNVFNLTIAASLLSFTLLTGCSTTDSYTQAFTHTKAPAGNGHRVEADLNRSFKAARAILVQQGFAIQSMDANLGVIKASRGVQDLRNKDMTYNIVTTIDITSVDKNNSIISIAANQQSILHTVSHDWWHLLFIFPIFPTGTHYENVVVSEGEVIDPAFYKGFFDGLNRNLELMPPAPAVVAVAPAPVPVAVPVAVVPTTEVAAPTTSSTQQPAVTAPVVSNPPEPKVTTIAFSNTPEKTKSDEVDGKKANEESPVGSVTGSITVRPKVDTPVNTTPKV